MHTGDKRTRPGTRLIAVDPAREAWANRPRGTQISHPRCRAAQRLVIDRAFAFEALARASAVGGDRDGARAYTEQALTAADDIQEDEERTLLLNDLASIPGQPRFW